MNTDYLIMNYQDINEYIDFPRVVEDDVLYLPVPRRIVRDSSNPLEIFNDVELRQRFRFSGNTIRDVLLPMVYPTQEQANSRGLPIPPIIKLCTALRYYASGSYQRICGDLVNISQSSVSRLVKEVSVNISSHLPKYIKFPPQAELERERLQFYDVAGFPGVIGCIDGTHIEIKSPGGENAEVFRCRKSWFSINVQVVSGARHEIRDIVIRWPGSTHDSRIFNNSALKLKLEGGVIQGILLGDSAYPQTNYLFTPVTNPTTSEQLRYNSAHKRTRNVVERTFGQWKGRFRCINGCLNYNININTKIIASTAILHNICVNHERFEIDDDFVLREAVPSLPATEELKRCSHKKCFH